MDKEEVLKQWQNEVESWERVAKESPDYYVNFYYMNIMIKLIDKILFPKEEPEKVTGYHCPKCLCSIWNVIEPDNKYSCYNCNQLWRCYKLGENDCYSSLPGEELQAFEARVEALNKSSERVEKQKEIQRIQLEIECIEARVRILKMNKLTMEGELK